MTLNSNSFDRIIVGGGLFGIYAGLVLARKGFRVAVLESSSEVVSKASKVNQARLHSGLHYPRSILTAKESIRYFERFESEFGDAIRTFRQFYAISKWNSQTSASQFEKFISNLNLATREADPSEFFNPSTVEAVFEVKEPSFDYLKLKELLLFEAEKYSDLEIRVNSHVNSILEDDNGYVLEGYFEGELRAAGIIICAYANTNTCRSMLGLNPIPLQYELAQVILGKMSDKYADIGFTVMDGPFWSLMPFGHSNMHSLTSVGLTPRLRSVESPSFDCQNVRRDCTPNFIKDCTSCPARPKSEESHFIQQMNLHLADGLMFNYEKSLFTIKTVLKSTAIDDARPTLVIKEMDRNIWTVFSGKVSTLFDLEGALN